MRSWFFLPVACVALASGAAVEPSELFGDHAVLRRAADTPVFGFADAGEKVRVSLAGACGETVADSAGKWCVRLDLRAVGTGPFDLAVNDRISHDVLVGEVWLCSGQSNMSFKEGSADDAETAAKDVNPQLRCFLVQGGAEIAPVPRIRGSWLVTQPGQTLRMTAVGYQFGKILQAALKVPVGLVESAVGAASLEAWCDPEALAENPRGKAELDRQIAFMAHYRDYENECDAARRAWERRFNRADRPSAGMPAQGWRELTAAQGEAFGHPSGAFWVRRTVAGRPGRAKTVSRQRFIEKQWHFDMSTVEVWWNGTRLTRRFSDDPIDKNTEYFDVPGTDVKATNELAFRVFNATGTRNVLHSFHVDGRRLPYAGWSQADVFTLPGLSGEARASLPPNQLFCLRQHYPVGLHNGKIAGLVPMGLSGVIWYQGETNSRRAEAYDDLFPAFIASWRKLFRRPDLPFGWCQLAGYTAKAKDPNDANMTWPRLREAQDRTLALPHTGQAVLLDAGEESDIHPRDKRTPGRRLAAWALHEVYGRAEVPYKGPRVASVAAQDGVAVVTFADTAKGLVAHDLGTQYIVRSSVGKMGTVARNSPAAQVEGFSLAGADGVWHWAEAATIDGNRVCVSSPAVPKPVQVRYGWAANPWVNLYNTDGFPAVPFERSIR